MPLRFRRTDAAPYPEFYQPPPKWWTDMGKSLALWFQSLDDLKLRREERVWLPRQTRQQESMWTACAVALSFAGADPMTRSVHVVLGPCTCTRATVCGVMLVYPFMLPFTLVIAAAARASGECSSRVCLLWGTVQGARWA